MKAHYCIGCGAPVTLYQRAELARDDPAVGQRVPGVLGTLAPGGDNLPAVERLDLAVEERRLVTVLFADVVGFTSFSEQRDPEVVRRVMSIYFERLAREIRRFDGIIEKFIGDAIVAIFGAPVAHEDDPQRSVNAALEMQAAITEINQSLLASDNLTLQMRIGIMTGQVVGGMRSFEASGGYTITGDVVNTAARLQSAAGPGQILVGELTYRMSRGQFIFESLPPLTLKGKQIPVPAYLVKARLVAEPLAARQSDTPLIGHQSELRLLQEYMQRALAGDGQLIAVVGEAGVGKSRLLVELRRWAEGLSAPSDEEGARTNPGPELSWHWVANMSFLATTQYATLAALLRSLLGLEGSGEPANSYTQFHASLERELGVSVTEEQLEACVAAVGGVLGLAGKFMPQEQFDAKIQRRMLLTALRVLVMAKATRQVVVMVLDDAQWIDQASLEVLDDLIQIVPGRPILILATHRSTWQHTWSSKGCYRQLNLGPLSSEECQALVSSLAGNPPLPESLIEHIALKTGGNPFFTEEIVHTMRAGYGADGTGAPADPGLSTSTALPATIEGILATRIDALEVPARRLLQIAAVIGQVFTDHLLSCVCETDLTIKPALEHLIACDFITEHRNGPTFEVEYRFRHGLIQEVAYQHLLIAQRESLHLRTGRCLERLHTGQLTERSELLAYHFSRSPDKERAVHYLLIAGDHAMQLYAHEAAYRHYRQAISILEQLSALAEATKKAQAHERLGDACALLGKGEEARIHFKQSLALYSAETADATISARLHCRVGDTWVKEGDFTQALACYAQAEDALAGREHDVAWARVRLVMAQISFRQGQLEQTHQYCDETLSLFLEQAQYKEAGDVYNMLAGIELRQGRVDSAIAHLFQSVVMHERSHDLPGKASCYGNLGVIYASKGEPGKAIAYYKQGLELFEKTGDLYAASTLYCNLGMAYALTSEYKLALQSLERGAQMADEIGFRLILGEAYCQLARVCRITGQWQRTISYLKRSQAIAEQLQAQDTLAAVLMEYGCFLMEQQQTAAAAGYFTEALAVAEKNNERIQVADACNSLALLALADGDHQQAKQWLEQAAGVLDALNHARCSAESALTSARLALAEGEIDQAFTQLEHAQALAQETGNVLLRGQCQRMAGTFYTARGEEAAAQAAFEESRLLLRRIGALPELGRAMADYATLLKAINKEAPTSGEAGDPKVQPVLEEACAILAQVGMEKELDTAQGILRQLVAP